MKHKVNCVDCGKTERIEVTIGEIPKGGWLYQGRLKSNSCQTEKYFYEVPEGFSISDDKWKKVKNECYDPSVKPKYVEMWVCPECAVK